MYIIHKYNILTIGHQKEKNMTKHVLEVIYL